MKSDIDYIKIASFNRNAYVGRSKSLKIIGAIFFFSLVLQEFFFGKKKCHVTVFFRNFN